MAAWLTAKAPILAEGECIGKVAQDNLKQFKDTLYDIVPFSLA